MQRVLSSSPFFSLPQSPRAFWSGAFSLGLLLGLSGFFLGRAVFTVAYIYFGLLCLLALWKGPSPVTINFRLPPSKPLIQLWVVLALLAPGAMSGKSIFLTAHLLAFPLLLLALCLAVLPPLLKSHLHKVLLGLGIMAFLSLLWVLSRYFIFSENALLSLSLGGAPLTPVHHIRYSFVLCIASWSIVYLAQQNQNPLHKKLLWILALLIALGLHILSVKSGLLAWYFIAFAILLSSLLAQGWKTLYGLLLVLVLTMPLLSYKMIPSFRTKINYFFYDLGKIGSAEAGTYSDAKRWEAMKTGFALFLEKPLSGHGQRAFQEKQKAAMLEKFPQAEPILPHTDWLTLLGYGGLITVAFFGYSLWHLFAFWGFPKKQPALAMVAVWLIGTVVDNHFATSTGIALFVFPALLLHSLTKADWDH